MITFMKTLRGDKINLMLRGNNKKSRILIKLMLLNLLLNGTKKLIDFSFRSLKRNTNSLFSVYAIKKTFRILNLTRLCLTIS